MTRTVDLPPGEMIANGVARGGWWHDVAGEPGRVVCDLCPRACVLRPGDRGFCFVRENRAGELVLSTYGRSTGFCIDPIEKKPLNHFYPGTSVLSFGTAGCNLGCKFCQNWSISKSREVERLSDRATPEMIARAAGELGCRSVAFTYNDPVVWAEYAIDAAKACRAVGIKTVAVTAGYISPAARRPFFEVMDAANVDLKGFTEEFYQHLTLSHLQPVLDTLEWLAKESDTWVEITNLVIPQANDGLDEIRALCDWVLSHLGDETPVHFTAFHPDFRLTDRPRTPPETLVAAYDLARQRGLKYVYTGNVDDVRHQSTYCGACGKLVIERNWYELGRYELDAAQCRHCGETVPGRFANRPGNWGRKRVPVNMAAFDLASSLPPATVVPLDASPFVPDDTMPAAALAQLADWARQNLVAMTRGAVAMLYAPHAPDGNVAGVELTVSLPDAPPRDLPPHNAHGHPAAPSNALHPHRTSRRNAPKTQRPPAGNNAECSRPHPDAALKRDNPERSMASNTQLAVFAKFWEPGAVKTRLAADIGAEPAARIARGMVLATLARMAGLAQRQTVVFAPLDRQADWEATNLAGWEFVPQAAGDLGMRMQAFVTASLAAGTERIVLLGADSPTLPIEYVQQAFDELARLPVTLGPAEDGGFYLLGLSCRAPAEVFALLFHNLPWSNANLWHETTTRLRTADIPFHELPPWYDIDTSTNLIRALKDGFEVPVT